MAIDIKKAQRELFEIATGTQRNRPSNDAERRMDANRVLDRCQSRRRARLNLHHLPLKCSGLSPFFLEEIF